MWQVVPGTAKPFAKKIIDMLGIKRYIAAPLVVEDEVVGVFSVQSEDLTENDVPAISAFAHQMAAAWHRARLFEQARQEVAERRRAEEALRFTQFAVDRVSDAAFWIGPDARFVYVNDAACQRLGYSREELLGMTVHDIDPDFPAEVWPAHWEEIKERLTFSFESRHRGRDGRIYPVEVVANYVEFEGREYNCAFARDITERKQTEQALYDSLEEAARGQGMLLTLGQAGEAVQRARTPGEVFSTIGDEVRKLGYHAVVLAVSEDQSRLTISHMTFDSAAIRAAEKLTNLTAGRYSVPVIPGSFHAQVLSEGRATFVERAIGPLEETLPRAIRPLAGRLASLFGVEQAIYAPLDVAGEAFGLLVITGADLLEADVPAVTAFANQAAIAIENTRLYADLRSQMVQLQSAQVQLVQSAKLAAVGELAAGVAHELNNPLTGILGFAELLVSRSSPDDLVRDNLQTIAAEARRAREIVHNLLGFARQRRPHKQWADINETLRHTLGLIRRQLETNGVVIDESYDPAIEQFDFDVGQMQQVFLNLMANAAQAMPEGGCLSVRSTWTGDGVVVAFSDTGEGIPPEVQERIFEPFFTTKPTGTGLGLSVSLGIVQEHGGHITLTSQAGQGSTFTVWLPLETVAGEEKDAT
jgi:PAS domain S-box-containing protein